MTTRTVLAVMVALAACSKSEPKEAGPGDLVARAEAQIRSFATEIYEPWATDNPSVVCPPQADLQRYRKSTDYDRDPWGTPIKVICDPEKTPRQMVVASLGPDKLPNTSDDIIATLTRDQRTTGRASPPPAAAEPTPSAAPKPPAAEEAAIAVTAVQLFADYQENEIAAEAKYNGKRLKVSGKIEKIAKVLGDPVVEFKTTNEFMPVYAKFKDDSAVTALKRGQKVTVICRGDDVSLGHARLADCAVE